MELKNSKTLEKNIDLKEKVKKEQIKKNKTIRIYRSFLTIVLIACILQMAKSTLINISKVFMYQAKIHKSITLQKDAKEKHEALEKSINHKSSFGQMESIARNNLKMAAKDEVLVIINKVPADEIQEPQTFKEKMLAFFAQFTEKDENDI